MVRIRQDRLLAAGRVFSVLSQLLSALSAITIAITAVYIAMYGFAEIARNVADASGVRLTILPGIPVTIQMVIAVAVTLALFVFFGNLRKIINTVEGGDPFEAANAQRLTTMAWLLLGIHLAYWVPMLATISVERVSVNGYSPSVQGFTFDAHDLPGVIMVLVLFILARVFRHGAAMRDDLEGTV